MWAVEIGNGRKKMYLYFASGLIVVISFSLPSNNVLSEKKKKRRLENRAKSRK